MISRVDTEIRSIEFYMRLNVHKLQNDHERSKIFVMQGVKCYIDVYKGDNDYLHIFLAMEGSVLRVDVGRRINASFKLLSTKKSAVKSFGTELHWRNPESVGDNEFIKWKDLTMPNNGFVVMDKAVLDITITFGDPFYYVYNVWSKMFNLSFSAWPLVNKNNNKNYWCLSLWK